MQKNTANPIQDPKRNIWKPFWIMMTSVSLPWLWIIGKTLFGLFSARIRLMIPNATAKVVAGDISRGAILLMVGLMFLNALITSVGQLLSNIISQKTQLGFHKFMIKKTLSLPVPYYDKNMANQLITRVTSDSADIGEFFGLSFTSIPSTIYTFVGTFVILFSYNWRLVVLMALMVPVVLSVSILNGKVQFKWRNRVQTTLARLGGYMAESLANIPLIKVFAKEKREEERGDESIENMYKTKNSYLLAGSFVSFLASSENLVQTMITVLGGAYLVRAGHIDISQWIAFYLYAAGLTSSFRANIGYYESIKRIQGSSRRMSEVAAEQSEDKGGSETVSDTPGDVRFENVTFAYDKDNVLSGVSFTLPKGKTTAIVGKSGTGKSTIFGLLERFYVPQDGQITLDGKNARDYSVTSWRKSIGYVPQSSPLFSGTIRYNMTYGLDRSVTEEELIKAAKDANIYDYVMSQPDGFDSDVGERGIKLSGGQKQRIAIARALLKDPKILLLDEATSNLDAEASAEVQKAMDRLKEGRTTVVVAHEMKAVENADQILVLDGGRIVDQGTHDELMRVSALYKSLRELQTVPAGA